MNMHTTITAKLPAYTPAEARALEDYYLANMPGAGLRGEFNIIPDRRTASQKVKDAAERREVIHATLKQHGPVTILELNDIMPNDTIHVVRKAIYTLAADGRARNTRKSNRSTWEAV